MGCRPLHRALRACAMTHASRRYDRQSRATASDVPSNYVRRLLSGSIALTASGALNVAVAAISIGLAMTMAGAEVVGQWSIVTSMAALLGVLDLGLSATVTRFTADATAREERSAVLQVWVTAALAVLVVAALSGALVVLFPDAIAGLIQVSDPTTALWLPAVVASQMASGQLRAALIGLGKATKAGALEITGSLTSLALTLILLHRGLGLDALAAGVLTRAIVMIVPGVVVCASALGHVPLEMPKGSLVRSLFAYSVPMFAAVAAGVAFLNLGRISLSMVSSIQAVGVYEAANRIALILPAAASPILTTALPLITARRHEDALVGNVTKVIQEGIGLMTGLLAGALLIVGLPVLGSWIGGPVSNLGWTLSLLLVAYLLVAGTGPTTVVLRAQGLQWMEAVSLALGTLTMVATVFLLAPGAGALGAAAAIAVGATVNVGILKATVARKRLTEATLRIRTLAASCSLLLIAGLASNAAGITRLPVPSSRWILPATIILAMLTAFLLTPTIRSLVGIGFRASSRHAPADTTRQTTQG